MAMRGKPHRARSPITIDVRTFGWDRALIATLRHPTLPWFDGVARELNVDGIPLAKASELGRIRSQVNSLQAQLSKITVAQVAAASGAAGFSGSVQVASSGGFTFPLPKSAAAPPSAWSPDQGVDISAPGNTPEYAVCSGTIVLHGIGGFGSWAPRTSSSSADRRSSPPCVGGP